MRALCGSIITSGALIGLGLAALGFGVRFQGAGINPDTKVQWGATSMTIALVILIASVLVGLAIAFLGLAYHHERRHRELRHEQVAGTGSRMPV